MADVAKRMLTATGTGHKDEYRPSASAMLVRHAQKSTANDEYDYEVLLCERTQPTAWMPQHCVFPGGAFDSVADESLEWLAYFQDFGVTEAQLLQLRIEVKNRPHPLLTTGAHFPRDISLRIAAIRETFEEVGVLLCRSRDDLEDTSICSHIREDFERESWQQAVHKDAKQFLELCKTLRVVPDLWSLHEWSVWRSPATSRKKYDTALYIVALPCSPKLLLEPSEIAEELWVTPSTALYGFAEKSLWLPPMQYYELCRLTHVGRWKDLLRFASKRSQKGSTLLKPVYYRCADDVLTGTFPGDDFCPADSNSFTETIIVSESADEFRRRAKHLHRIEINDAYNYSIEANIQPLDGHLSPVMKKTTGSKL